VEPERPDDGNFHTSVLGKDGHNGRLYYTRSQLPSEEDSLEIHLFDYGL
jgi:hypothetical protein